jgi:hypothetical protein
MELPNGDEASVPDRKLREYLLSETHPVGKAKARFWRSNGFDDHNLEALREALIAIARSGEMVAALPSPHGVKYVVEGMLYTPLDSSVRVQTVWIVESGQVIPRLVPAYPD